MVLLEVIGLTKWFGGLAAVNDLDFQIHKGQIVGLIGPNGSGKSTIFNLISGFLKPTSGQVIFKGEDITGLKPHMLTRKGIARTFQHATLFWPQPSLQNALLGCYVKSGIGFWESFFGTKTKERKAEACHEKAMELLKFVGLDTQAHVLAGNLSHGYQNTLSLAAALGSDPEVLLLDEPLTALNPERVVSIQNLILRIRDKGSTIMVIEHNMKALFPICDRVIVLDAGEKIAEGTPEEVRGNPEVIRIYLGGVKSARDTK